MGKSRTISAFKRKYKKEIVAYSMLAYPLLHWGVFFLYSLFRAFYLSFTKWNLTKANPRWVGLENYRKLFENDVFMKALGNTLQWTVAMAIGPVVLGLIMALLIQRLNRGKGLFTTLLYWPALVSAVISTAIQTRIFSSSATGLANQLMVLVGLPAQQWFDNPKIALYSLMIMPFFFGFSSNMLFFIAGLRQIPQTFDEAASVDGAHRFKKLWHITLPLLKPVFFLNLILSIIGGFRVIAPMQLITKGGPNNNTMSVVLYLYKQAFDKYNMGSASATAFVLFIIILIVTMIELKIQGEQISYE